MKKQVSVLLTLLILWSLAVLPALAADNQAFINSYYQVDVASLNIVCSMPDVTQDGTFTVTVAGEEASVLDVSTVEAAGTAKTVYCLVDISGTMSDGMDEVKEVLRTVAASLGENDNMVIAQFGNELTESAFLTDQTEIESAIEALEAYHSQDTNLYLCLMDALSTLQTNTSVNKMPVMLVLSDGIDDQKSGATQTEALIAVAAADIPIFTVAPNLDTTDADEVEGAKILGGFARGSAGGVHFPKSEEGSSTVLSMTGEEIGAEIVTYMNASLVVSVDMEGVAKADSYTVAVTYDDGTGNVYKDSVQIAGTDVSIPAEQETDLETTEEPTVETSTAEEPTTETPTTEEPTTKMATTTEPDPTEPMTTTEPEPSVPTGVWIGLAVVVILLLVLILLLAALSRKRKREREEAERREQERAAQEAREREEQLKKEEQERQEKERQKQLAEERRRKQEAYARLPKLTVRLAVIGKRDVYYTAQLAQDMEATFGSDMSADCVLYAEDRQLMPVHFKMIWTGKAVYMWNAAAGNVTSHNGVVIDALGRVAVESGDIIRAGGTEYRTYWEA